MVTNGTNGLQLNVDGQCDNLVCNCHDKPDDIIAEEKANSPAYGFIKVTHKVKNEGTFKLNNKLEDGGQIGSGERNSIDNVESVSVYYWNDKPSIPILIGISIGGGHATTYYARSSGKDWSNQLRPEQLEKELDYQNCYNNNAVTVDLTRSNSERNTKDNSSYCCHKHGNIRVTSAQLSCKKHPNLSSTLYYKHKVNIGSELSSIKYNEGGRSDGPRKRITLSGHNYPSNVRAVYVFYCEGHNPKLIYIEGGDSATGWFKKADDGTNGNEDWTKVTELTGITPDNFGTLECKQWKVLREVLESVGCKGLEECPPPGVIINIKQNTGIGSTTYKAPFSDEYVKVTREKEEDPYNSGFWNFKHSSPDGNTFQVSEVKYGQSGLTVKDIGVSPGEEIQHLALWYWKGDQGMTNPLLVEVLKDGKYTYTSNKGGGGNNLTWQLLPKYPGPLSEQLQGDTLETQLDEVRCLLNNEVTLDLSYKKYEELSKNLAKYVSTDKNKYCCTYHNNGQRKVTVQDTQVSCKVHENSTPIPYYKHDLSGRNSKLAKIKYYVNDDSSGKRKRITLDGSPLPIYAPITVSVFYCGGKPVLIYVNSTGKDQDRVKGWYKKDGDNQPWVKVHGNLPGNGPESIKSCKEKEFKELVTVLREFRCSYNECTELTQPSFHKSVGLDSPPIGPPGAGPEPIRPVGEVKDGLGKKLFDVATATVGSVVAGLDIISSLLQEKKKEPEGPKDPQPGPEKQPGDNGARGTQQGNISSNLHANQGGAPQPRDAGEPGHVADSRTNSDGEQGSTPTPSATGVTTSHTTHTADAPVTPSYQPPATELQQAAAYNGPIPGSSPGKSSSEDPNPTNTIVSVTTGFLVTSALACFAGYKFYTKYKGDPWVRQI